MIFTSTFVSALQLLTDLNKDKCIYIILLTDNRIVSYKALVFEMKVILHLKEIMKKKSFEVGFTLYFCKWVKELRIISAHQKNAEKWKATKRVCMTKKLVSSVPYTY